MNKPDCVWSLQHFCDNFQHYFFFSENSKIVILAREGSTARKAFLVQIQAQFKFKHTHTIHFNRSLWQLLRGGTIDKRNLDGLSQWKSEVNHNKNNKTEKNTIKTQSNLRINSHNQFSKIHDENIEPSTGSLKS